MFKKNFIKFCVSKGESPSSVCRKVGIAPATYSCWTEESVPRKTTLYKIADYLGVTVEQLLADDPVVESKENLPSPENRHSITIRGRDGSVIESDLTDEQIELFKQMLKQVTEKK